MSNVLFEKDDWRICRYTYTVNNQKSELHHLCKSLSLDGDWWHSVGPSGCLYCCEEVPDDIKGLWILHEWDR